VFWDKHITLRITAMLSRKCLKVEGWRLNIKVKERPFAEGSGDLTCARAFHL
jgi:hypothetical protein